MARKTKLDADEEHKNILTLLKTKLAGVPSLLLAGKSYPRQDLIAAFQAVLDARDATSHARAMWRQAVIVERKARALATPLRNNLKTQLESTYGTGSSMVLALGIKSKKRKKPSVDTSLAAVEKRKATRAARKTMGKKQRKKIR